MDKSTLWELLNTFSGAEKRAFSAYLESPYFAVRTEARLLYGALLRFGPDKKAVFHHVFPQYPAFDDHRLRLAMSFLYRNALDFVAVESLRADPVETQHVLARSLRRRHLNDASDKALKTGLEKHLETDKRDVVFWEEKFRLALEQYQNESAQLRAGSPFVQTFSEALDHAFMARKLWQACSMWSHQSVSNTAYDFGLLDEIMRHLEQRGVPPEPAIAVYYHYLRALEKPGEPEHFSRFKTIVLEQGDLFSDESLRDLLLMAVNFCIRQNNEGNTAYRDEQFELYKMGLEKNGFLVDGYLPRYTYLNVVTTALLVRRYDWAEQFIHDYRHKLQPAQREGLYSFNRARLAYHLGQYDKALRFLRDADLRDVMLSLAAKTLQVKLYYEMDAFDLLESHLQALQTFITRKKAMGYHRLNYQHFIRLVRRLLELPPGDRAQKEALRTQILETRELAEKDWLLGRLG